MATQSVRLLPASTRASTQQSPRFWLEIYTEKNEINARGKTTASTPISSSTQQLVSYTHRRTLKNNQHINLFRVGIFNNQSQKRQWVTQRKSFGLVGSFYLCCLCCIKTFAKTSIFHPVDSKSRSKVQHQSFKTATLKENTF